MDLRKIIPATVIAASLSGVSASAAVLTFEGVNNTIYNAPITRLGFDIGNVVGDQQHFHEITSTGFSLPSNGTGVMLNDRNTRIFIEKNGGGTFSLGNFDAASAGSSNLGGLGITVEGFLGGFSVGSLAVANLGAGYMTLFSGLFGNVDRVVFDGTGLNGGFILDNVSLDEGQGPSPVPIPAGMPLLVAALGALGLLRRKRT